PVEAPWSSNTFRKMFPGAQWLGDGTSIAVQWKSQVFVFNVEAILDPASNALVGVAITDAEDEDALRRADPGGLGATPGPPPGPTRATTGPAPPPPARRRPSETPSSCARLPSGGKPKPRWREPLVYPSRASPPQSSQVVRPASRPAVSST